MSTEFVSPSRRQSVGRPRVHDDEHILNIALEVLAQRGFQGLTMAKVAEAAGASTPALYRRWRNKTELVSQAVAHAHGDARRPAPTGDVRNDLIGHLTDVRTAFERTVNMSITGVFLSEELRHPEFLQRWRDIVVRPRRRDIKTIVAEGVRTGQLDPDADPELVSQLLMGAYYAAHIAGDRLDDDWDARIVDHLLAGITSS